MGKPAITKLWIRRLGIVLTVLLFILTTAFIVTFRNSNNVVSVELSEAYEKNDQIVFRVSIKNEINVPVTLNELETIDGRIAQAPGCELYLRGSTGFIGTLLRPDVTPEDRMWYRPSQFTLEPGESVDSHIVFSKPSPQPGIIFPLASAENASTMGIAFRPNRKLPFYTRFARQVCRSTSNLNSIMSWVAQNNSGFFRWLIGVDSNRIQIPIDDWIEVNKSVQNNAIELKER